HGIWLTPADVELVRDRGVTVVHNPVSNMKLGSGIAPIPELLRHGVNVALGTDGMCSNDGNDMFATLKTASLLHKLWEVDYEEWLGAVEAWAMATAGGPRPQRARRDRARPPRRPRAARPGLAGLHPAQRPAEAARARFDDPRRVVGDGRRRVAHPRRRSDGRRRDGGAGRGAGARRRGRRAARRRLPDRAGAPRLRPRRVAGSDANGGRGR